MKRPLLIVNGKPVRYRSVDIRSSVLLDRYMEKPFGPMRAASTATCYALDAILSDGSVLCHESPFLEISTRRSGRLIYCMGS